MKVPPRCLRNAPAWALAGLLAACGGGGGGGGGGGSAPPPTQPPPTQPPPTQANRAPTAANDVLQVTNAGVASLAVLANDADPDNDALTVTITSQPFVGTAAVNSNNTVRIDGLPAGFRGFTQFGYQVRDPAGATANASAAVFVDTQPFRLVMNVDEARNGASDLYLTNLASAPVKLGNATEGALRLGGFRASRNGATVAYTRVDPQNAATTEEFWFVRTATPTQPVRVALPGGTALARFDGTSNPQYEVSPDGRYVAFLADVQASGARTLYLVDTTVGGTATAVNAPNGTIANVPGFSADSRALYWAAQPNAGTRPTLWRVAVDSTATPTRVSREGTSTSGLLFYQILRETGVIVLGRTDSGIESIAVVDPAAPGTERVISHTPAAGEAVFGRAVVASPNGQRVLYVSRALAAPQVNQSVYVAPVATAGAARQLVTGPVGQVGFGVYAVRPDNAAVLLGRETQTGTRLLEVPLDGPVTETPVADVGQVAFAITAAYDGTNDRVAFERALGDPNLPPNLLELRAIGRSAFGATAAGTKFGTAGQIASIVNFAAIDRGVVVLGERAPQATTPIQPLLVNVAAPTSTFALSPGVFAANAPNTGSRMVRVDAP